MRQNSITQQILTQYLQKRLNRAGGSVQQVGPQQLLLATGNDLPAGVGNGVQRNAVESLYAGEDDIIGDERYDQGQITEKNAIYMYSIYISPYVLLTRHEIEAIIII